MPILELKDVRYSYSPEKVVLRGVNCVFECGTLYALVGKSGAGKSTLLSLMAGLDLPGTKILMKSGRELPQVLAVLQEKGLLDRAQLVANCGLPGELVCRDLRELDQPVGYYATIIVKEEAP